MLTTWAEGCQPTGTIFDGSFADANRDVEDAVPYGRTTNAVIARLKAVAMTT